MGIGLVTFSLPHFLTGPYRVRGSEGLNSTSDNICKAPSLLDQVERDNILQNIPGLQKIKSLVNSEGKKLGHRGCLMSVRLCNFNSVSRMQDFCPRINMLEENCFKTILQ